jgi:hypothetical protein
MEHNFEVAQKELILSRFLGTYGYRTFLPITASARGRHTSVTKVVIHTSTLPTDDIIVLSLTDVDNFILNQTYSTADFHKFAKAQQSEKPLNDQSFNMIKLSTRAWNRIALRIRAQQDYPKDRLLVEQPNEFGRLKSSDAIHTHGRVAMMRVWVPSERSHMSNDEVVECEREIWRSVFLFRSIFHAAVSTHYRILKSIVELEFGLILEEAI